MKLFEVQKCPLCKKMRCNHEHKNDDSACAICHHHPCDCSEEQEEVEYKGKKIMIGKHHDDSDTRFDPDELSMGIENELQHTNDDRRAAKNIAKDHLIQIPDYYSKERKNQSLTIVPSLKTWLGAKGNGDNSK